MRLIISVITVAFFYVISLTGCSKGHTPKAPVADFTISIVNPGELPGNVNFISTSTNATSFTWEFGDGSPLYETTEKSTLHIYSAAGNYAVRLVAIGAEGRDSIVKYVPITGQ